MKRKVLGLSLALFMGLTAAKAQNIEVPVSQNPMIVKIAASWCPPCGTWGWTFFDDVYEDNAQNAILFVAHHSGDFQNTAATEMTANFDVYGQPRFIFDGVDQNVSSNNVAAKRASFAEMVNSTTQQSPDVQTGIEAAYDGDVMTVDYATKFFNTVSGDYYLGIYLVEKLVVGYQASIGQNAQHKNILRDEISSDNSFGHLLASGTINSGEIFEGSLTINLESYLPENLEIVSILWKKEGDTYHFVNANADKDVQDAGTSGIGDLAEGLTSLEIHPTVINEKASIIIDTKERIEKAVINIYDSFGRKVQNIYSGLLRAGSNEIEFYRTGNLSQSSYYIVLSSGNTLLETKRVFFEH